MFELISAINPEDVSTYDNNLFVTIDIDWAHDTILSETFA
mgnify:FL=1